MTLPALGPASPILTAHLFAPIEARLLDLLRGLKPGDWDQATLARGWNVKDVAGHLLDTAVRKLSVCRDGWKAGALAPRPEEGLATFVNRMNADGVAFARRLSPELITSLLERVSSEYVAYHRSLDPFAEAAFAVSWAGETRSLNWFDTAREYTERWHHQQQIRLAVGKPGIETRELYHPVLDAFMRALPFTYRAVERPAGTTARFTVSGDAGGSWWLHRGGEEWQLTVEGLDRRDACPADDETVASETTIPQAIAWRLFTKGIDRAEARRQVEVRGDQELGLGILSMVSIVG